LNARRLTDIFESRLVKSELWEEEDRILAISGPIAAPDARRRLIVALDVPDRASALDLIEKLSGLVTMYKIGNQLFTAEGPALVREVVESGAGVFLDLKFHDIPNTVGGACESAAALGVSILNVHALGGVEMMRAAARSVAESSAAGDREACRGALLPEYRTWAPLSAPDSDRDPAGRPAVIAVTVLTSMNDASLDEVGIRSNVQEEAVRLATLARTAGLDGVVASPNEIEAIRERVAVDRFLIVVPGVRPARIEGDDQKRVATPAEAVRRGADYIVVGRPIIAAPDPRAAADRIIEEIAK
jgi:orotidine-5'-phosphate decarboxylase